MEKIIKVMMQILKSAVPEEPLDNNVVPLLTYEFLEKLYAVSEFHDLAHIVGSILDKNGLLTESIIAEKYRQQEITAVYRYERQNFEYKRICEALEKAEIKFMPLKGVVIRELYPEPWMRTSCDTDILVHRNDLKKAEKVLIKELGFVKQEKSVYDVTLRSINGVTVELHYDLIEENPSKDSYKVLKKIWENSHLKKNYKFFYEMTPEMFYFYHIVHIVKHFEVGGCGIRPLFDLWIMEKNGGFWNLQTQKLLNRVGLLRFTNSLRELMNIWFEEAEHNDITLKMQTYILKGGVYGVEENHILMETIRAGGKIKYVFSKIFVPYENMKHEFPILKKHRILTPVFEFYKWFLLLFKSNKKNKIKKLDSIKHIPQENLRTLEDMLENIGL